MEYYCFALLAYVQEGKALEKGGETMAMQAIQQVEELERESQRRWEAAVAQSKQQLAEAQKAARKLLDDSRAQAEAQVRQMMAQAEERAAKTAEGILVQARQDCEVLKGAAQSRLEGAAASIVEKVVKG